MSPTRHKYGVAPAAERQYNGVTYHSKAEAIRAQQLDLLVRGGEIVRWDRQVAIQLGDDFHTVVDFVIVDKDGRTYAEEIKGFETKQFKTVRRLWMKYGPFPMRIMKLRNKTWQKEFVDGA